MSPSWRLERIDSLAAVQPEWRRLADLSGNIFASWEWQALWWGRYGGDTSLVAAICRDGAGNATAVLPLYLWRRRPLRIARLLGHGPADELGPICAPGAREDAAKALRELLALERLDLFVAESLRGDAGWSDLLRARKVSSDASPVLRLDRGWEAVLGGASANLRRQVRHRERVLIRDHDARYRLADDPDRLQDDLTTLFALHERRWPHGSEFTRHERFHRDFAAAALARGWLRLWFLEVRGRAVAAWYGFRFAGVESYYQAGRDPAWESASVGFVLLAHSIRSAADDGMQEYRFLRGGERFKYRFASDDPGVETVVAGSRRAVALASFAFGVRARLRDVGDRGRRPLPAARDYAARMVSRR